MAPRGAAPKKSSRHGYRRRRRNICPWRRDMRYVRLGAGAGNDFIGTSFIPSRTDDGWWGLTQRLIAGCFDDITVMLHSWNDKKMWVCCLSVYQNGFEWLFDCNYWCTTFRLLYRTVLTHRVLLITRLTKVSIATVKPIMPPIVKPKVVMATHRFYSAKSNT